MVTPDYDARPTGKTLLDIAEERRAGLMSAASARQKELDIKAGIPVVKEQETEEEVLDFDTDAALGAFPTALLYTISLAALHMTLDVLCLTQYQQDIVWSHILGRLYRLTPALLIVVWIAHTERAKAFGLVRQLGFLAASVFAGCFIIKTGNEDGYYMVMKQAPPVGTIWVWSVVEMDIIWSVLHIVAVGAYMWWNNYGAF
jgi:hypothetical protein